MDETTTTEWTWDDPAINDTKADLWEGCWWYCPDPDPQTAPEQGTTGGE